jgi:peptide deformylase
MAICELVPPSHPVLRQKAETVTRFNEPLQALVDNLFDTMIAHDGVGLAAPQIGVSLRVFVARSGTRDYVFINPKIRPVGDEMNTMVEGCLSLPAIFGEVRRHAEVVITGADRFGTFKRTRTSGELARIFQHEMDHLEGVLFIDKTVPMAVGRVGVLMGKHHQI